MKDANLVTILVVKHAKSGFVKAHIVGENNNWRNINPEQHIRWCQLNAGKPWAKQEWVRQIAKANPKDLKISVLEGQFPVEVARSIKKAINSAA